MESQVNQLTNQKFVSRSPIKDELTVKLFFINKKQTEFNNIKTADISLSKRKPFNKIHDKPFKRKKLSPNKKVRYAFPPLEFCIYKKIDGRIKISC